MEQVNANRYRVQPGEEVTFQVTGTGVINSAAVFGVDTQLTFIDAVAGLYRFKVTKLAGKRHFGTLGCTFPPGTADNARFDTRLGGSNGGSFTGPSVPKPSPFPSESFRFEVVK